METIRFIVSLASFSAVLTCGMRAKGSPYGSRRVPQDEKRRNLQRLPHSRRRNDHLELGASDASTKPLPVTGEVSVLGPKPMMAHWCSFLFAWYFCGSERIPVCGSQPNPHLSLSGSARFGSYTETNPRAREQRPRPAPMVCPKSSRSLRCGVSAGTCAPGVSSPNLRFSCF